MRTTDDVNDVRAEGFINFESIFCLRLMKNRRNSIFSTMIKVLSNIYFSEKLTNYALI